MQEAPGLWVVAVVFVLAFFVLVVGAIQMWKGRPQK